MTTDTSTEFEDLAVAYRAGAINLLRRQMRCLFGDIPPNIELRLTLADEQQLEAWAESLLQAKRLGEVFNDSGLSRSLEYDNDESGLRVHIRRIGDQRYHALRQNSLSIDPDLMLWLALSWEYERKGEGIGQLAKFYAAFRQAYGESGNCYDDYKGAFNFAFELDVVRPSGTIPYLLNVASYRSGVEFRYYKLIDRDDPHYDRHLIHPPFADEFSKPQMETLSSYLCGYAQGYWETTIQRVGERDFLKTINSNLILFGFQAGEYFVQAFDNQASFKAAKNTPTGSKSPIIKTHKG